MEFIEIAKLAKQASVQAQKLTNDIKNKALVTIAKYLDENKEQIFDANKKDMLEAEVLLQEKK